MEGNPTTLILTLDSLLDHEVSLVLYGRGGLSLGFDNANREWADTQDIDGIITLYQLQELSEDEQFWASIDQTNELLSEKGLYITHLFGEEQVFLRKNWIDEIVPILRPETQHLKLFRPATIDLVLTKMMRGADPQDMADAEFLIREGCITVAQLEAAFTTVNLTDIVELQDAFERARPVVLEMAGQVNR